MAGNQFGKGIPLVSGFDYGSSDALDHREVKATLKERDAMPEGYLYNGLIVYVEENSTTYQRVNNKWEVLGTSYATINPDKFTKPVPINKGGTGADDAAEARGNLGVPPTNHSTSDTTYGVSSNTNYGHAKSSTTVPKMDGTASAGTENAFAHGDHIHPTDTSRASKSEFDQHSSNKSNPHSVTKSQVGLGNVDNESKTTMFNNPVFTGKPTAPTPSNSSNDTQIATTAFTQSLINEKIAASDAMIYKGTIGTSGTITSLPNTHKTGWTYRVITASTYAGFKCEVGDLIICLTDGTQSKDSDWTVAQTNIDGAVTGPTSSVNDNIAVFDGVSGKVIKNGGTTISAIKTECKNPDNFSKAVPISKGGTGATDASGARTNLQITPINIGAAEGTNGKANATKGILTINGAASGIFDGSENKTITIPAVAGDRGYQGYQGSRGYQGYQGVQGARGYQGYQGNTGPRGFQGYQGVKGVDSSVAGPRGYQGYQGKTGVGSQGPQGVQGPRGYQGYQGKAGTGSQGPRGYQGYQGNKGDTGAQGPQGATGNTGAKGDPGSQGPRGYQGYQGKIGATGPTGSPGSSGVRGFQGYQGKAGTNGSNGSQGPAGPRGFQGYQGNPGAQGVKGDKGAAGNSHLSFVTASGNNITIPGTCTAQGFYQGSDIRLKKNIKDFNNKNLLNEIFNFPIKTFDWKDNDKHALGIIAQDIQKIYPDLVKVKDNGYLEVNYIEFILLKILSIEDKIKSLNLNNNG